MKNTFKYITILSVAILTLCSCEEILMEKDISNKVVNLIAPVNDAQFSSTSVSFTWATLEDATSYHLQIAKPNFTDPIQIVLDTLVSSTSYTKQLNIGQYEWRVKATNSAYETLYTTRTLTVVSNEDFQNNTVTLSSPANNLITKVAAQNLTWETVIGATSYQIQILDSSNAIINDQTLTTNSLNYTFPQGSYQWKVRASNVTNQTLYTARNILVDTTVPNTPSLTAPTNASTQTAGEINFTWSRTPNAGSTEKDSIFIYTNSTLTNLQSKTEATSPHTATLATGTFYWYVKSFDEAGNVGAQSTVFNVIIN
ncbi:MAG: hypothetical protein H7339_17065 [Arcicella sp.]|nr:hypothetical protein [Arcicella sp.]